MSSIPTAAVSRLVIYLRVLNELDRAGVQTASSDHLAEAAQVSAFQVRKDLAYFGRFGTRGAGYRVAVLRDELRRILGLTQPWQVAIMGMGRLGQALADYPGMEEYGFQLRAAFDVDPRKVGRRLGGLPVEPVEALPKAVAELRIDMAFLTVPGAAAQAAADRLVAAGIKGILNFAPTVVKVPESVQVEPVDFMAGLKRLAFYVGSPLLGDARGQAAGDGGFEGSG